MLDLLDRPRHASLDEGEARRAKIKKATGQLLERLREFHGCDEAFSARETNPPVAESPEVVELPPTKETWFCALEADPVFEPKTISVADIQRAVARRYRLRREDITSHRRTGRVIKPRQIAMFLAKALTTRSSLDIGRFFGNRDHSTILHGVRKIELLRQTDTCLEMDLRTIAAAVGGSID
jgi:hypothetical protein